MTQNKKWEIEAEVRSKKEEVRNEDLIQLLLSNRGVTTKKDIEEFLHPSLEKITASSVGIDKKQLKKTLARTTKAIKDKEQIIVFGDYDVDGVTASAILWETLNSLGANALPYIPDRMTEGYGLSESGIRNLVSGIKNVSLIITVDNGIVANKAVDFANEKGIDVIITDHHVVAYPQPDAFAIIHTTKLCGAGVAYVLANELKRVILANDVRPESTEERSWTSQDDNHLELAALGTVADLVPLTDANRTIVKFGIERLAVSKRAGIIELFKQAACEQKTAGVYEIGHIIAPRLNAAGRIGSAMDSLRLLCTTNKKRAEELAALLGVTNKERQVLMRESTQHASMSVRTNGALKKLLVVAHSEYQQGVIGLVAGRLVEEFYRPAIVISKGEKVSKASVRSVKGFNIIEFLRNASDLLVDVGGHPMAAGFTIETDKIEVLQKRLEEMAETMVGDDQLVRSLRIDCELPLEMINNNLYQSLQQLAPFGMANPEPTFVSRGVVLQDVRYMGKERQHVKLEVRSSKSEVRSKALEAVGFGMAEKATDLKIGESIDVVYTVDENTWNGNTKLQLKIKDLQNRN